MEKIKKLKDVKNLVHYDATEIKAENVNHEVFVKHC